MTASVTAAGIAPGRKYIALPMPKRIPPALLFALSLLCGCSGITVSRDPERGFYRHVLRKDADTADRKYWEPLRDSSRRLVRDPARADSLAQAYRNASGKGRARLIAQPEENEESVRGTEAMDAYFRGAALVRAGRPQEALPRLDSARRLDTTLTYASDIDLWTAWAFRATGDTGQAERRFQTFLERSTGLCPSSANLGPCDDSARYAQLLDSLGAFGKVVGDSAYFANRHLKAPNLRRDYYGIAPRERWLELYFVPGYGGPGLLAGMNFPVGKRFELEPFGVLPLGSSDLSLYGLDVATRLVEDRYNRYGLKLRTAVYGVDEHIKGKDFSFVQARLGLEGSYALRRNWLVFASMGKFYRSKDNPVYVQTDSGRYRVWFGDYVDVGTTWFWSKNWGITAREFRQEFQIGIQGGPWFLGYDPWRKQAMFTWSRMENLL